MFNVIAYTRVSTQHQALKGTSLDGQRLQLREFAKVRELRIKKWFTDTESARHEEDGSERQSFTAACGLSLKTGWPILVVDASRFSRTEESYRSFLAEGGKVYDISGFGKDGAEMASKIARAKFDGDKRSRATRKGQKEAKARGVTFGSPFPEKGARASAISRGKEADLRRGELERLRDQAAITGVTGANALADWLDRQGHLTAQGAHWTASNVRRVLRGRALTSVVYWPANAFNMGGVAKDTALAEVLSAVVTADDVLAMACDLEGEPRSEGGSAAESKIVLDRDEAGSIEHWLSIYPDLNEVQSARLLELIQRDIAPTPEPALDTQAAGQTITGAPATPNTILKQNGSDSLSRFDDATTAGYPLSRAELEEFSELLNAHSVGAAKIKKVLEEASRTTLPYAHRASILNWIAEKRSSGMEGRGGEGACR